jgi:DNA-binding protein H-NS
MATMNLRGMDVDALLSLRAEIDKKLGEKRNELEQQLSRLGLESNSGGHARAARGWGGSGRRSAMKGRKVAPKFRGPGGETWAGRGARPRWLTALIKEGRKIDEFAINKLAAARKGPVAKKSRRKRK